MSKRYGRNQKRRHLQEIEELRAQGERLTKDLEVNHEKIAQMKDMLKDISENNKEAMEYLKHIYEYSIILPPKQEKDDGIQDTNRVPVYDNDDLLYIRESPNIYPLTLSYINLSELRVYLDAHRKDFKVAIHAKYASFKDPRNCKVFHLRKCTSKVTNRFTSQKFHALCSKRTNEVYKKRIIMKAAYCKIDTWVGCAMVRGQHYYGSIKFGRKSIKISYVMSKQDAEVLNESDKNRDIPIDAKYQEGDRSNRYVDKDKLIANAISLFKKNNNGYDLLIEGDPCVCDPQLILVGREEIKEQANKLNEQFDQLNGWDCLKENEIRVKTIYREWRHLVFGE